MLGDCWKEGGESLKSKIIYSSAGRLAGSGGGEWFGGVITKGREEKVNVGFGFGGFGPESRPLRSRSPYCNSLSLRFIQRR